MRKIIILLLLLITTGSARACIGLGCSTYYGDILDYPWRLVHKIPTIITHPVSILDDPHGSLEYVKSKVPQNNIPSNQVNQGNTVQGGNFQYQLPSTNYQP